MRIKKTAWIAITASIALSSIALTAFYAQTNPQPKPAPISTQDRDSLKKAIRNTFPKVAFDQDNASDESTRDKRSKYDRISVLDPKSTANAEATSSIDWESGLPALPVNQSEIILLGNIKDARAFLSANKGSVFSEFQIDVTEVFKNSTSRKLSRGDALFVEREGGIVTFANGSETWFRLSGQKMPQVGKKYLLFISHEFPWIGNKNELYLITAYEIDNDNVIPLDFPGGGHPIAETYKGRTPSVLMRDLLKALRDGEER
jgi:hypothetical protein